MLTSQKGYGRGTLDLVFDGSARIDPRITFTRSTVATRVNAQGLIESVPINAPRLDYDPVTLACKGLLIEEARTNLYTYSQAFDDASWNKNASSILANDGIAPDGTVTADKVIESGTSDWHGVNRNTSVSAGAAYTESIFLKSGGRTQCHILFYVDTIYYGAKIDLTTGAVSASSVSGVTSDTASVIVQDAGLGWYRISFAKTMVGTLHSMGIRMFNGSDVYTGNGTSGIYVWQADLQAGSFTTSPIPTTSAQVTRAADVAVMTGTNFSDWYRQDEGTFFVTYDVASPGSAGFDRVFDANDGTANNAIGLVKQNGSGAYYGAVTTAGASQATPATPALTKNTFYSTALAYKVNDFALTTSGGTVVTDTSGTVPTVTRFGFADYGGGVNGGMHIKRLTYYPTRLTNATLQGLTST
jgi:hypothetical protein